MKRQNILIAILALLVAVGLPWNYMDGSLKKVRAEIDASRERLLPMARQAAEIRRREVALAAERAKVEAVRSRLVTQDPFATIQGELTGASRSSGVLLGAFTLERGEAIAALPGMIRYTAVVEVSGSRKQYLDFLHFLERNQLLIELPEVDVKLGPVGQSPEVRVTMPISFFGAASPQ